MAQPCIQDTASIRMIDNPDGALSAEVVFSPLGGNIVSLHADVPSGDIGLYATIYVAATTYKVVDPTDWFYNDNVIHYHHDTAVNCVNSSPRPWSVTAEVQFDPGSISLVHNPGEDTFAPFDTGVHVELLEDLSIFDTRDGTVYSQVLPDGSNVNPTTSVGEGGVHLGFTVPPGQARGIHWFRWVQRLSGLANPSGYHWGAGSSTAIVMRVG